MTSFHKYIETETQSLSVGLLYKHFQPVIATKTYNHTICSFIVCSFNALLLLYLYTQTRSRI